MGENNFPTVRIGSLWLLFFAGVLIAKMLYKDPSDALVTALSAVLAALGATHLILVGGKSFIMSKWSGDAPATETTTTTKTSPVVPSNVGDMTVNADNVKVNT